VLGIGIGFFGVIAIFISWDKARHGVIGFPSNNTQRRFYGEYEFPT